MTRQTIFKLFIVATAALAVALGGAARAQSTKSEHTVSLTLQAGETYVINDLNPTSTPAVRVLENPHALVLHGEEPGKLVLLGAESGHWAVSVTRSDGEAVTYNVQITSVATPGAPLEPGKSPAALGDTGLTGARPPARHFHRRHRRWEPRPRCRPRP
jgi:hypothetical protein